VYIGKCAIVIFLEHICDVGQYTKVNISLCCHNVGDVIWSVNAC